MRRQTPSVEGISPPRGDARPGGPSRVEPGALHAGDGAVVAGHGGDQRRQTPDGRAFAVAKLGVIAQRREAALQEPPGAEMRFSVRAVDGAATRPETARRLLRVVRVARGRRSPRNEVRDKLQGEEGPRLVERRAQRRRARAVADDIQQVAMLGRRGIGELAGLPRRGEPHEERAPAGAVEVARDPVAASAATRPH